MVLTLLEPPLTRETYADLIVPQGGENKRGIAILCKYIEGLMEKWQPK